MTNARTSSRRPSSHLISGITRSMPSISSRGNSTPQSSTTILPRYSTAVMFLPISPRPPRGMILRESLMWEQSYPLAGAQAFVEPLRPGHVAGSHEPGHLGQPPPDDVAGHADAAQAAHLQHVEQHV